MVEIEFDKQSNSNLISEKSILQKRKSNSLEKRDGCSFRYKAEKEFLKLISQLDILLSRKT